MLLKLSGYATKTITKQIKFTECVYRKECPRKVPFSKHVYFVQICMVFKGPVTILFKQLQTSYVSMHHDAPTYRQG